MSVHSDLIKYVQEHFPLWKSVFNPAPQIVSDAEIVIKKSVFQKIEKIVSAFYNLRDNQDYVTDVLKSHPGLLPQSHYSVLMSFDFHIIKDEPKMIEINTNASFALLSFVLDQFSNKNYPNFLADLQNSFLSDYKLFFGKSDLASITITDEKPTDQKAFFEFLMYQKLFESWNWKSDIIDVTQLHEVSDFIYNRHTDFYLKMEHSKKLKQIYDGKKVCVSPHPTEYALLADKLLFLKFQNQKFMEQFITPDDFDLIKNCVPETLELSAVDPDVILKNRKKYIFKPKNSFGGKAVYRGESLSVSKFEELKTSDYLVQEFLPPPKHDDLKWDLRCYVYRGKIQISGVRAYHGQITNFKELGGGFARLKLV